MYLRQGGDEFFYPFINEDTQHKGKHRDNIRSCLHPFAICQMQTEQDDIPRLRVGENMSSCYIAIGIQRTANHSKQDSNQKSIRHLSFRINHHL